MPPPTAEDLDAVLSEAAAEIADPALRVTGPVSGRTWQRADTAFAALSGAMAEFRLGPEVVDAALRTPGTTGSPRGRDWVTFTPDTLERFDRDRVTAWFQLGWRLAGRGRTH